MRVEAVDVKQTGALEARDSKREQCSATRQSGVQGDITSSRCKHMQCTTARGVSGTCRIRKCDAQGEQCCHRARSVMTVNSKRGLSHGYLRRSPGNSAKNVRERLFPTVTAFRQHSTTPNDSCPPLPLLRPLSRAHQCLVLHRMLVMISQQAVCSDHRLSAV